MKKKNYLQKNN